ncbi:MAG: hypothetical protein K0R21_1615 [Anaerocolumna sp.]|nr:hypothetical protein [Anaerocolumna sp.]
MEGKMIGFVGSDKYELILYLSRILYHLGKKVLLVDYAENEALLQSITVPETLKEDTSYIDYRGIDFIQGKYFRFKMKQEYDYILMDFGYIMDNEGMLRCSKVIFVTDLQLHNLKRIKNIEYVENEDKCLVIKDVFQCKIKPEYIINQIGFPIDKNQIFILYQDSVDLKYKVSSQYDHKFTFHKLSKPTQCFLKDITKMMDNQLEEKDINLAYKKAERGL